MKNHYVSQFIIKGFQKVINVFDIKTGHIDEKKRPNKVFYKNDAFSPETEKLMQTVETKAAHILQKIENSKIIEITRQELIDLKKYMLICSVRCYDIDLIVRLLKGFKNNADRFLKLDDKLKNLKSIEDFKLTNNEIYERMIKVFARTRTINDICIDELATREIYGWALAFMQSYMAFWDTPNDKEFILSDCNIISEYEGFHQITGGLDLSKFSYLLHMLKSDKCSDQNKSIYAYLLQNTQIMFENFNLVNINSHRVMVMINPFFRLYFEAEPKPDIWPAIIQNKELFNIPRTEYVLYEKISKDIYEVFGMKPKLDSRFFGMEDKFIYKPKMLSNEEITYINSLILMESYNIIGFNDPTKIIDSIYFYHWMDSNYKSITAKRQSNKEITDRFLNNLLKSPYMELIKYCEQKKGIDSTQFIFLFEKMLSWIYKDIENNPYIYEYLLSMKDKTIENKNLDFFGEGDKKMEYFQNKLNTILKHKN